MPQEYDNAVNAPTADDLLQPLLTALVHAPLGGASALACLLLDHFLTVIELGCQEHTLDLPAWLEERREDVAQALNAGLMHELLAAEDELRSLEDAVKALPALRDRIAKLAVALGLPERGAGATITENNA